MNRRLFTRLGLGLFGLSAVSANAGESKPHRAAFQFDSEDRRAQSAALGNVRNYAAHYKAKGAACQIEIVVFGLGYSMVRDDISMMKGEIETLQKQIGAGLTIAACHNTREAIAASMGKKSEQIPLLSGVKEVPSGIVRLAELQEQGWAYLRP